MADISYLEAWQMWLQGKPTIGNDMLGVPMLWWGRAGKILTFVAGAVVLIDLVGPEKLSRYGDRLVRLMTAQPVLRPVGAGFAAGTIASLLIIGVTEPMGNSQARAWLAVAGGGTAAFLVFIIGFALQHPNFASVARWVSVGLLLIGFHFDLLAS
ncbi:hypothetical protein SAMN05216276_104538 [Streptosporangium subroseum]|uniref:Uncharacterized protein n=1 Tax=Streptosporangium subroseum TaxID=106412 RepID=A0A239MSG5_9ACTN|nr:hypothetical protein [Streptosporangium subroseum]SNT45686.1 hypothetical protein SAMN05216276_104538 [Streptosporangium subroseum]